MTFGKTPAMRAHPICPAMFCAALVASGWASQGLASTASEDFWELSPQQLSQVEVNVASRSGERARDASSSVTVFTRRDIEATGVSTVEELMAFVPGFAVQRSIDSASPRTNFAVRGRRRGGYNRDVLIMRDGLPLNSDFLGGAGLTYYDLPLHNVKQIEVIRGPGSALYGSNAFVGVINIVTDDSLNEAGVGVGSHDLYAAHANVSQAAGDGKLIAQAQVFDGRGEMYRDLYDGMRLTAPDLRAPEHGHDVALKWKNKHVGISVDQTRRDESDFIGSRFADGNHNRGSTEANAAHLTAVFGEASRVRHSANLAYKQDKQYNNVGFMSAEYLARLNSNPALPNGFALPLRDLVAGSVHDSSSWLIDWQSEFRLADIHRLVAGISWRQYSQDAADITANYDVINQTSRVFPFATYDDFTARANAFMRDDVDRDIGGIFVQDRMQLRDYLRWDVGLRYDHDAGIGEALSPRSSIVWAVNASTDLKLMYSRAFRTPSLEELYNAPYNVDLGNPDLDPETIDTVETAWAQRVDNTVESVVTLYYSKVKNGVDPITLTRPTGGTYEFSVNQSDLSYSGFEWELMWQACDTVSVRAAMHHSFHRDGDIDSAPQNDGSLIISYKRDAWLASLTGTYYDNIETPARIELDAYTLWGVALQYDIDAHWRVALSAQNVLDKNYRAYTLRYNTTGGQFSDGIPGEGARQLLTLSYNY